MNVFKESPRDARSTTTGGIRARLTRTLSMALAVAITAILLPAAISLAKTGSFGAIPVVEAITGISPRMLSERLRDLEAAGLVERKVIPSSPPGVEYRLTINGRRLGPIIEAMHDYARQPLG